MRAAKIGQWAVRPLVSQAAEAIRRDARNAATGSLASPDVWNQHRFLCHGDGSACGDGCDTSPDADRRIACDTAAELMERIGELP